MRLETRRGVIELKARVDRAIPEGVLFVPFCYAEAPANFLTNSQLDPYGEIPDSNSERRAWRGQSEGRQNSIDPPANDGRALPSIRCGTCAIYALQVASKAQRRYDQQHPN